MTRYAWLPTESAPTDYPMEIVRGDLIFDDGSTLYIPDRRVIHNGWGEIGSTHIVADEFKPVPVALDLTWFSYTENAFYQGKFTLPKDKMETMFAAGLLSPLDGSEITYDRIIVGMAPGGDVSVWMGAETIVTETAVFKGTPVDLPFTEVIDNPAVAREGFIRSALEEALPEATLERLAKEGVPVGKWRDYTLRFAWMPALQGGGTLRSVWVSTLNGEDEWLDFTQGQDFAPTRARPIRIRLYWETTAGMDLMAEIDFDEAEVIAAFAKLTEGDPAPSLRLMLEPSDTLQTVDTFLMSGDLLYRFEKTRAQVYQAQ